MNFEDAVQQLRRSSPTPILGAVFFLFLSLWIRAYRWSYLLRPVKQIAIRPLFRSILIGFMGNHLFPFRAGEVMRAVSIGKTQRISKAGALGSILLERMFDGLVLSLSPFLLLAVLDLPRWVLAVNLALLGGCVTGLLLLMLAAQRGWTEVWPKRMLGCLPGPLGKRLGSIAGHFLHGMKAVNHAGALLPVLYLSVLCWFCNGMYFFLVFESLDLNLSLWAALVLQAVIGLGVILPAGPGYVGNFEYFTVLGLALFGIAQETAFAYALLAHICEFIPGTAVGLFFALRNGFQIEDEMVSSKVVEVEV
jgi:glycosyltransferase 2 family protein